MSKYILTLLLSLSSHTLAATSHVQNNASPVEEKPTITQTSENITSLTSTASAEINQMKETSNASSTSLDKEPSTTQERCRHSFLKHFFGYFCLNLPGAASSLGILILIEDTTPIVAFFSSFIILLLNGGIAFIAAYFYTKSHKACKPSLFKHTLGFCAWEVVGSLIFLFFHYFLLDKIPFLEYSIPIVITLLLCAIGAFMYVFYFNYSHEGDPNQIEERKHSAWENFFGYLMLTLSGAWTMICSFCWISGLKNMKLNDISNFNKWDTVAIMISVSGLLISLGISFIAAYFYTKSDKAHKYSLKKHTIGFFAFCVEGYLATLIPFFITRLFDDPHFIIFAIFVIILPIVTSLSICGISAKMYVRHFKKLQQKKEEEKQATKSFA